MLLGIRGITRFFGIKEACNSFDLRALTIISGPIPKGSPEVMAIIFFTCMTFQVNAMHAINAQRHKRYTLFLINK